jgi:hypothetical protein
VTAAWLGILTLGAASIPIVLALRPGLTARTTAGLSLILGLAISALILLLCSVIGIPWSLPALALILLALSTGSFLMMRRQVAPPRESPPSSIVAILIELLAYFPLLGYARYVFQNPIWQGDFWAVWGVKGRVFLEANRIDWNFLTAPDNHYAHPHYAPLFPLMLDALALIIGHWWEHAAAVVSIGLAAALLLILRDRFLHDLGSPLGAAMATVAIANLPLTKWIGLADSIVLVFATAAVLLLREALPANDNRMFHLGAVILGLAAMIKTEGGALVAAAAAGVLIYRPRMVLKLWPAAILVALWPAIRLPHALSGYLTREGIWSRAVERITDVDSWRPVADFLVPYQERIWIAAVIAVVAAGTQFIQRERFLLTTLVVQILFGLTAYVITPFDLKWHVATSWQRVTAQLIVLVAYLGLIAGVDALTGRSRSVRIPRPAEETAV